MTDERFEARLASGLRAIAEGGVRPVDHYEVAETILASGRRWRLASRGRAPRSLFMVVLGVLVVTLAAGTIYIGSQPGPDSPVDVPVVVGPDPTDPPIPMPLKVDTDPSTDPVDNGISGAVGAGPCAAMVQRLMIYGGLEGEDPTAPLPTPVRPGNLSNGDLLVTNMNERGEIVVGRLDTSRVPPEPTTAYVTAFGHFPGFPMHPESRIVAAPYGDVVAVEEGDLGPAGCGDPLVIPVGGGIRRPFPVGSFELVSDLAWAPDSSALYGVRRPTIDADGGPFVDAVTEGIGRGPGTVLRWDATTGVVSELGSPCPGCGIDGLTVSPDGARLAANQRASESQVGSVVVRELDGTWRTVAQDALVAGWVDDGMLVLQGDGIRLVSLDGTSRGHWDDPCCHGTGYAALLSPDGTTLAGMTLSSDFMSWRVTLMDVRDGTTSDIWGAPDQRGCSGFERFSAGRLECDAISGTSPGATVDPAVSISGDARVVAWSPDGTAVALLDQRPDSNEAVISLVRIDGSGATPQVTITVPDLSQTQGFPNVGPSVAWLAATPGTATASAP